MPYLSVLGSSFEKPLSYLKSAPSNLPCSKLSFKKKKNVLKLGTKNVRFPYLGAGIWKYYYHIWNQRPRICLVAKFGAKIKIVKFGTRNALFEYSWVGIWKWYSHNWNQHPRICLSANVAKKQKRWNLVSKMPYVGILGLEFQKTAVKFEINSLEFV